MATQYTSLLGLALPTTGELSGSWGDTVNSFLTQYVDASIAGAQVISGSQTAVTLSTATGATLTQVAAGSTGSAQYQIVRCTGNPAGTLTVTAPATSKTYIVINSTSTTQPVQFVGAGPTAGVTIASGERVFIAWNGTDFVRVGAGLGIAQTFTAAQTFRAANAVRSEAAATQDAVVLAGRAGGTSSFAVTLTPTTLTGNRTLTLPDGNVTIPNGTIAVLGTAQTFTAAQTFRAANSVRAEAAATQDAVVLAGRAGGTGSFAVTLTPTTLTDNRTFTLPDGDVTLPSGTIAVLGTAQTFTAAQTFRAASAVRSEAAATQDAIILAGRAGGTSSFATTLTPGTLAASNTLTLPTTTTTLAGLGVSQTFSAAQTFSSTVTMSGTTTNISIGTSQTSGTLTLGGTAQTGTITVGRSTGAQTIDIGTGVNTAATKTINIGTGGTTGTTNITIGNNLGTTNLTLPTQATLSDGVALAQTWDTGSTVLEFSRYSAVGTAPSRSGNEVFLMQNVSWNGTDFVQTSGSSGSTFASFSGGIMELRSATSTGVDGTVLTALAAPEFAVPTVQLGGNQLVLQDYIGSDQFLIAGNGGRLAVFDNNFLIVDDVNTNKGVGFQCSGITAGNIRTMTVPDASGTIALTSGTQTFSGTTTFSAATVTVGTSTAASTYGLGTGATLTATTKTINIGTAGVSGSTTNINIGSAVSGATNNITLNGLVDIDGNNSALLSTTANNTLRFTDLDTSTALNQPLGKIEWFSSDATVSARVSAYILATAQGTSGGGNLEFGVATNAGTVTEQMQLTGDGVLQFNSGYGSVADAYGCRAWVNFNGTGTVAIRASGNVSSITDNGTGDYTVNFTTAMPDANYSMASSCSATFTSDSSRAYSCAVNASTTPTTSLIRIVCGYVQNANSGTADPLFVNVAIFR